MQDEKFFTVSLQGGEQEAGKRHCYFNDNGEMIFPTPLNEMKAEESNPFQDIRNQQPKNTRPKIVQECFYIVIFAFYPLCS